MASIGLEATDFAGTGNLETLGRASISLELGHCFFPPLAVHVNQSENISLGCAVVKLFLESLSHQASIQLGNLILRARSELRRFQSSDCRF